MVKILKNIFHLLLALLLTGKVYALDAPMGSFDLGGIFKSIFKWITKTFTQGGANVNTTFAVTVILFFILVYAIVLLIMRAVNILQINAQPRLGATIAFAISAIATIAVFWYTKEDPVTILKAILRPFGIWVGLILSGFVAILTYSAIINSGIGLANNRLLTLSISVAMGIIFAGLFWLKNIMVLGVIILIISIIIALIPWGDDAGAGAGARAGGIPPVTRVGDGTPIIFKKTESEEKLDEEEEKIEKELLVLLNNLEDKLEEDEKNPPYEISHASKEIANKIRSYIERLYVDMQKEHDIIASRPDSESSRRILLVKKELGLLRQIIRDFDEIEKALHDKTNKGWAKIRAINKKVTTLINKIQKELRWEKRD